MILRDKYGYFLELDSRGYGSTTQLSILTQTFKNPLLVLGDKVHETRLQEVVKDKVPWLKYNVKMMTHNEFYYLLKNYPERLKEYSIFIDDMSYFFKYYLFKDLNVKGYSISEQTFGFDELMDLKNPLEWKNNEN